MISSYSHCWLFRIMNSLKCKIQQVLSSKLILTEKGCFNTDSFPVKWLDSENLNSEKQAVLLARTSWHRMRGHIPFWEHVSDASVREVMASVKCLTSQISSVLEHFQSISQILSFLTSWNLALANDLLTGSVFVFLFLSGPTSFPLHHKARGHY